MQDLPRSFTDWYSSLKAVKANGGPANGSIAAALVVLNRLRNTFDLNFSAHVAEGGMQLKGVGGAAVSAILKSFGEERPFAKEGGRTNRGGPAEIRSLLIALGSLRLDSLHEDERNERLIAMQLFLVERVQAFHNRQRIKLIFDPTLSTWHIIKDILQLAMSEGKAGFVAQHLVGAKLQLRFPTIPISNESASTADMQTNRPGDFFIGSTTFHVTVAPMPAVYEKCRHNISQGFKPLLLVPDDKLAGARQNAELVCERQISVESIESFVSQNINEISQFKKEELAASFKELLSIYNQRVDAIEVDKALMIELPSNLQ